MLVCHFAASEAQSDLDLVTLVEEALHRPHLHVVIVIVDGGAHLDLLDLDDFLLLAGFVGFLLLFVFELAVIHQLADGRLVVGRDLDHVEAFFVAQSQRLVQADLAILMAVVSDQENGFGGDFVIDARAILGRRGGITLKTSRNYDSPLLLRPCPLRRQKAAASRGIWPASRTRFRIIGAVGSLVAAQRRSGGTASACSIEIAASSARLSCPSTPSFRRVMVRFSASLRPKTIRLGVLARLCWRT